MNVSRSQALSVWLFFFGFCAATPSWVLAQSHGATGERPACGADGRLGMSANLRVFRQLAQPDSNSTERRRTAANPIAQASHETTTREQGAKVKASPPANRIPTMILNDPDVATVRLVSASEQTISVPSEPGTLPTALTPAEQPSLQPIPPSQTVSANAPVNTRRPTPIGRTATQSDELLTRILQTKQRTQNLPQSARELATETRCSADQAPLYGAPEDEPFASLQGVQGGNGANIPWDVSTRRPRKTESEDFARLRTEASRRNPDRSFATPHPHNRGATAAALPGNGVALASAIEPSTGLDEQPGDMFWTQPASFEGGQFPVAPVTDRSTPPARGRQPAREFYQPTHRVPPMPLGQSAESARQRPGEPKVLEGWLEMPSRQTENRPTTETTTPKSVDIKPRRWAGLFVEDTNTFVAADSRLTRVSFDAPVLDTEIPGDVVLAQANGTANATPATESRLRIDFLDDPDETDARSEAIRSLIGNGAQEEIDSAPSLLDEDAGEDEEAYREKYDYAFEEIEPKPIQRRPRKYAATLKDIFTDDEVNPQIEQAYCEAIWACAGGRNRSQWDIWNENIARNNQILRGGSANGGQSGRQLLPWGISPTLNSGGTLGITNCRVVFGGGWCTGACGGHCETGCKVKCPSQHDAGGKGCSDSSCSELGCTCEDDDVWVDERSR